MYDGIANNWSGTGVAGVYRVLGTSSHKFTRQASFSGDNFYKVNNQSENNDNNFDNPSGSKVWSGNLTIKSRVRPMFMIWEMKEMQENMQLPMVNSIPIAGKMWAPAQMLQPL